jgi:hypothetical protein
MTIVSTTMKLSGMAEEYKCYSAGKVAAVLHWSC